MAQRTPMMRANSRHICAQIHQPASDRGVLVAIVSCGKGEVQRRHISDNLVDIRATVYQQFYEAAPGIKLLRACGLLRHLEQIGDGKP